MKSEWQAWIDAETARHPSGFVRGLCGIISARMADAFPDLKRVAGFAYWTAPNGRQVRDQHWWCVVMATGEIIDPTASQFTGAVRYEELDLDNEEHRARIPTGVCMDCGADVYNHDTFCDEDCENATRRYMGLPPAGE